MMTTRRNDLPPANGWHGVIRWHRRLGVAAATLVAIVAITGMLLNHAGRFGLDQRKVSAPWLMAWYGMETPATLIAYATENGRVIQLGDAIQLEGRLLARDVGTLKGAAITAGGLAVATANALLLFTMEGRLIERLDEASLPGRIESIGRTPEGTLALRTACGNFISDPAMLTWRPTAATSQWARPVPLSADARERLMRSYRGAGLPWSRVLLDLHSGRILGSWGPLAMDAAALGLLVLAATGILHWLRRRGAPRRRS